MAVDFFFMTNLNERMLPDVRIEPATVQADAHPIELPRQHLILNIRKTSLTGCRMKMDI